VNNFITWDAQLNLSPLPHTWILDLDGTVLKHNGYLDDGRDSLLPGAIEFLRSIPTSDMVIFLTSRSDKFREATEVYLKDSNIRYDSIIYNAPFGERILVNDKKPSGLQTAYAINVSRDHPVNIAFAIDDNK